MLSFVLFVFVCVVVEEEEFFVVVIVVIILIEGLFLFIEYLVYLNILNNSCYNENDVCFINLFFVIF